MDKKVYVKPNLKVVEFHVERGYAGSVNSLNGVSHQGFFDEPTGHEYFLDEMFGHESFTDNTDDFGESDFGSF